MKFIKIGLLIGCSFALGRAGAQDTGVPLRAQGNWMAERLAVTTGNQLDLSSWPVSRQSVADLAKKGQAVAYDLSTLDRADIRYLLSDNNDYLPLDSLQQRVAKWRVLRHFYPNKAHLLAVNKPDFVLRADPVLHFSAARESSADGLLFANQRGGEIRARIGKKVHVYTSFLETQTRFPTYINRWIDTYTTVPGNGLFKNYVSSVSDATGYDFNNASGYVAVPLTPQIGAQFGHGRHFIGQGYRSMFLSDFSNNYLYLKLHSKFWRFTYDNYYTQFSDAYARIGPEPSPVRRFASFHHLNFNAAPNVNFGIFEAVAYKRQGGVELQYLNPVILYRSIEHGFKSSDNILVGADFDAVVFRRVKLYGQLLLDEFLFANLINPDQKGWWGNKIGTQIGLKYFNALGIDHLDLQVERNSALPYTYSHLDSLSNWTHFGQPLAHPMGANFKEWIAIARYRPHPRWTAQARYLYVVRGEDESGNNWGGNPNLTYNSRPNEYGNFIGQGDRSLIHIVGLDLSWEFAHNMFLDFKVLLRNQNNTLDQRDLNSTVIGGGLRVNYWGSDIDF